MGMYYLQACYQSVLSVEKLAFKSGGPHVRIYTLNLDHRIFMKRWANDFQQAANPYTHFDNSPDYLLFDA